MVFAYAEGGKRERSCSFINAVFQGYERKVLKRERSTKFL